MKANSIFKVRITLQNLPNIKILWCKLAQLKPETTLLFFYMPKKTDKLSLIGFLFSIQISFECDNYAIHSELIKSCYPHM